MRGGFRKMCLRDAGGTRLDGNALGKPRFAPEIRDGRHDGEAAHVAAMKDYYRALAEVKGRGNGGSAE